MQIIRISRVHAHLERGIHRETAERPGAETIKEELIALLGDEHLAGSRGLRLHTDAEDVLRRTRGDAHHDVLHLFGRVVELVEVVEPRGHPLERALASIDRHGAEQVMSGRDEQIRLELVVLRAPAVLSREILDDAKRVAHASIFMDKQELVLHADAALQAVSQIRPICVESLELFKCGHRICPPLWV